MGKICFGVDLGGTTVKMGIFTVDGAMLEEWEIPTRKDDGGKYILSDIADSINDKITNYESEHKKDLIIHLRPCTDGNGAELPTDE